MEKNKNIFFYKRNLIIGKDKIEITPEMGDTIIVCKDKNVAYRNLLSLKDDDTLIPMTIIETYSSEDLGEGVVGYQLCEKMTINGKSYNFVGVKMEIDDDLTEESIDKKSVREFYFY